MTFSFQPSIDLLAVTRLIAKCSAHFALDFGPSRAESYWEVHLRHTSAGTRSARRFAGSIAFLVAPVTRHAEWETSRLCPSAHQDS